MIKKLLYIMLFINTLHANQITIDNSKSLYENFELYYIEDTNNSFNIQKISKTKFTKKTTSNFNLGYKKSPVWFKIVVKNKSEHDEFILSLNEHFYEKADLYYFKNDSWNVKKLGLFTPVDKREVKNSKLSFDIEIQKNKTQTYYMQIEGKYAYFGDLILYEKSYFYFDKQLDINTLYFYLIGVLTIIIFFNLFLFLTLKEKIYFYYVGYSFFNLIYFLNISGLLSYFDLQYLIYDLQISAAFMIAFLILFSNEFLQTKRHIKGLYIFLNTLAYLFFIVGFLVVYSYQPWNKVINNFSGLVNILLIIAAIRIYIKGDRKLLYYILAMITLFAFVVLFTSMVLGITPYTYITRYGFVAASGFEVVIFSLMLANRYNIMKNETISSQKKLIAMDKSNKDYLENKVKNKTADLVVVNDKLKKLVAERELLLREVYHRVKNNFHVVIGMLWFESNKDGADKDQLNELTNRIRSMSMIHEQLYNAKDLKNIDIKEYLQKIIHNNMSSNSHVKLTQNIQNILLEFDDAVSLGVVLNEILTNAFKHNKKVDDFAVDIRVFKTEDFISLIINDNGFGFIQDKQQGGLGLKLIDQFCKKLPSSSYSLSSTDGTKFELNFKIEDKNEK